MNLQPGVAMKRSLQPFMWVALSVKNSSPVHLYFPRQPIAKSQRETKYTSLILCDLEGRLHNM